MFEDFYLLFYVFSTNFINELCVKDLGETPSQQM